jgi:hypothetical protein
MNVQHERVIELCAELRLAAIAHNTQSWPSRQPSSIHRSPIFLESLLLTERESRQARAREMFARVAGFPAIKTLRSIRLHFRHRGAAQTVHGTG